MGKYGWDSKIGDLLADERCVAVFKEILPAALESPLLKLVKGKPVGVVLDSQKKIPQEKRDALKAALEAIEKNFKEEQKWQSIPLRPRPSARCSTPRRSWSS